MPQPPDDQTFQSNSPAPSLGGSFQRRPIRDSIRVAKGLGRQGPGPRSFTTDGSLPVTDYDPPSTRDLYDPNSDAALPPTIKRYHTRKRSNTAPRAPPSSFRTFPAREGPAHPGTTSSTYSQSVAVTSDRGSSERGVYTPSLGVPSIPSSRRGSEASANGRPPMNNIQFCDTLSTSSHAASMTMRMDAFIDNKQAGKGGQRNLRLGTPNTRANPGKKDMSYWGLDEGRSSMSPVDSLMPAEMRMSESTGRGSSERDYFRGF